MDISTARWNDPRWSGGRRVLVTRYWPRGLRKGEEDWDEWIADAGPSRELLAAYHGKRGAPIGWDELRRRYLKEMAGRPEVLARLRALAGRGPLVLLCSSACLDPARCHRTLLEGLLKAGTTARARASA